MQPSRGAAADDPRPPARTWAGRAGRGLFPEAPRRPVPLPKIFIGLMAVALAAGLCLARQTGSDALDTIYAEDGRVFLQQALAEDLVVSVRTPYNGYVHVVPRVLAETATAVPVSHAAAALALGSALVVGALALVVFRASSGHIRSTAIRALVAASVVAVPVAQEEAFNNVSNLHWYFLFASVWVLLWVPRTRWEVAVGALVVFLGAMSDPLAVLVLPLAVVRVWAQGRPWDRFRAADVLPYALAAGLLAQFGMIAVTDATRESIAANPGLPRILHWFAFYVVGRGLFGTRAVVAFGEVASRVLVVTGVVLTAAVLIVSAVRRSPATAVVIALVATSGLFYVVPVALTGTTPSRYSLVPALLLLSAFACAADGMRPSEAGSRVRAVGVALVVVLALVWTSNFRLSNRRAGGPRWSDEVAAAVARCRQAPLPAVDVATTPAPPAGWGVTVRCDRLLASA